MLRQKIAVAGVAALLTLTATCALAGDVKKKFSIESARSSSSVQEVLNGDVLFYWAGQKHPQVQHSYGEFKTSKRTNGLGKAKDGACAHALASALKVFEKRAIQEGGNAVIDLQSNIKNQAESSATEYSCLVGSMMVNVALKGKVVTVKR
ncbi:excinuclease ABC subunit A [Desulfosediminicola sp.]|uniref:excinuclease ABC subunit A n=1 Tax=Desulfosediminicola sp. TaxID=2886825 RepID=UPI003AF1F623